MKAKDAMHKGAILVEPETSLSKVARKMRREDVGAIPIGENDRLIGMVTDRDICCRAVGNGRDLNLLTARDVMSLECAALRRVREEMGLTNLKIMVPFCRREEEGRRVIEAMAGNGLKRGQNGLEIYVMCEIPNNVIRIDAFSALFDGFSIGSNDLTQLTLGVDRDSEIVSFDFDERDPGMTEMLRLAVEGAHRNRRHVGICGEAPANYPDVAQRLVQWGIDSISVNRASVVKTFKIVADAEHALQNPLPVSHVSN